MVVLRNQALNKSYGNYLLLYHQNRGREGERERVKEKIAKLVEVIKQCIERCIR